MRPYIPVIFPLTSQSTFTLFLGAAISLFIVFILSGGDKSGLLARHFTGMLLITIALILAVFIFMVWPITQ